MFHKERQLYTGNCPERLTAKDSHAALLLLFFCLCHTRLAGIAHEGRLKSSGAAVTISLQTMHEYTEDKMQSHLEFFTEQK